MSSHTITHFLSNNHLVIGIAAVTLGLESYVSLGIKPDPLIITFLFFATILVYVLNPGRKKISSLKSVLTDRKGFQLGTIIVATVGILVCIHMLKNTQRILILALTGLPLIYNLPKMGKVKSFIWGTGAAFLKVMIIGITWSLATVLLPLIMSYQDAGDRIMNMGMERFLYITALAIPFDIKDINEDKKFRLPTLANQLGLTKAIYISSTLMFLAFLFHVRFLSTSLSETFIYVAILCLSVIMVTLAASQQKQEFYQIQLNGLIIIRGVSLMLVVGENLI